MIFIIHWPQVFQKYVCLYIYIYNGILLSHKKNGIMPRAATQMDLEMIILSEVSQKEKDQYHTVLLNTWNLNYGTNEPTYRTETDAQT